MPRLCRHFVVPPQHGGIGPNLTAGSFSLDSQRPHKIRPFVKQPMTENENESRGECQRFVKDPPQKKNQLLCLCFVIFTCTK